MSNTKQNETPEQIEQSSVAANESTNQTSVSNVVKPIDSYFTIEHQSMIAAKYRAKYSDADQAEHKTRWSEFAGNHFTMYILAETLNEARKAVFSANSKGFLNNLIGSMINYTPTAPGSVLTEMQVAWNKMSDTALQGLYEQVSDESQRTDLLKMYAKTLKLQSKTGKDTETAKAKFYHASAELGVTPNSIW